jgi:hypothetical protein
VFPVYHVFSDLGEWEDSRVVPSASSAPLAVESLTIESGGRRRTMVANLTHRELRVRIDGWRTAASIRVLDETNAEDAMRSPERFDADAGRAVHPSSDIIELTLLPYAIARLDERPGNASALTDPVLEEA